jgi:RNA polymerase sigma-70 factor (ECF subfamily)
MSDESGFYSAIIGPIEDRMIRAVWRITRNGQDAEDAMQDALLAVWKRRDRIGRHAAPRALVLKMCIDAAYDVVRRRARRRHENQPIDGADGLADAAMPPPDDIARRELRGEVLGAVARLSRCQAVAITLRVIEELPYEQVAAAMNCGEATARKHVERARNHLRVALAKHEPHPQTRSRS